MLDNSFKNQGDLLIVDDLADNLRVLSNILSSNGYRVRGVKNGAMALRGARLVPPEAILLDIRMPDMDGYEVCRRLKADAELCEIPIIFLSALAEPMAKSKAFSVGGIDYITKPFQVEEVLTRVKNQITIQRLRKQIVVQEQQLARLAQMANGLKGLHPSHVSNADNPNSVYTEMLSTIAVILDYSDRLSQMPQLNLEQYAGLRVIHRQGQNLLDLVNAQLEGGLPQRFPDRLGDR